MNERTEALAKQAAEYAIEFATQDQEQYIPKLMEKFAELIVKECANICFSEADGHRIAFGEHCGIVIKQHFGVEE